MLVFLKALMVDRRGATAVEYGLIVALIVIAIVASVKSVADENTGLWATVSSDVEDATGD